MWDTVEKLPLCKGEALTCKLGKIGDLVGEHFVYSARLEDLCAGGWRGAVIEERCD